MKHPVSTAVAAVAALALLGACDGSSASRRATEVGPGSEATLLRIEYGRLVDVYAYRRVEADRPDRRDSLNRTPVLVQRDVVVGPRVQTEELFAATGLEDPNADYRVLPFDVDVGHEELLILWDDEHPSESERFSRALLIAQQGLVEVAPSFRGQSTATRPIPVVPRNAAVKLTFSGDLGLNEEFFVGNQGALEVLEIRGDPRTQSGSQAFRPLPHRLLVDGASIVIDTSLIGREAGLGTTTLGLPASSDNANANIRIALPSNGGISADFNVQPDSVPGLNGASAGGLVAVIRDFRSGNPDDGPVGALTDTEAPVLVADVSMGITAIDVANRVITLDKRGAGVAVRGRIPFVDGGVDGTVGLAGGPPNRPTEFPLRSGDYLYQDVLSVVTGETVRLRAEVIRNTGVGVVVGDPTFPALGISPGDDDGGSDAMVQVQVASLVGFDSAGNEVAFSASPAAGGRDCTMRVHYYHQMPYRNGFQGSSIWAATNGVRDSQRVLEFLTFDQTGTPGVAPPLGTEIDPDASVTVRFSEPLDLESVSKFDNFVLTTDLLRVDPDLAPVSEQLLDPKAGALSVVPTRLIDSEASGAALTLAPVMGHHHANGVAEAYWFHMLTSTDDPSALMADLAGNSVEIFDRTSLEPTDALSVRYTLDANAPDNLIGWRVMRFNSIDEDGTPSGSEDFFGQFQMGDGALSAATTQRFTQAAEQQNLVAAARFDKGDCVNTATGLPLPPAAPFGPLYQCPSHVVVRFQPPAIYGFVPQTFGGVLNPLNPRGSRLQMTYREDDFDLGFTDASTQMVDVEQLYWAPFRNDQGKFDVFDRMSIRLAHSDYRPDQQYFTTAAMPPACVLMCESMNSGLSTSFDGNVLQGTEAVTVVTDQEYRINPNDAVSSPNRTVYMPYPRFEQSYTWRDSRYVSFDTDTGVATGLGGAHQAEGTLPNADYTANVSSPWITDAPGSFWSFPAGVTYASQDYALDAADFRGARNRDHDPIALPLLVDVMTFPDNPTLSGISEATNSLHIAIVGPCWQPFPAGPGGYFNAAQLPCGAASGTFNLEWPIFRVHSSGGVDSLGTEIFVDPANTFTATGGWILDPGVGDPQLGRFNTKPGDDHLPWAQADFVRRVSMVTFGFFDTLKPNSHLLDDEFTPAWAGAGTPGMVTGNPDGVPNFDALQASRGLAFKVSDVVSVFEPPLALQPAGTSVNLEYRFADTFQQRQRTGMGTEEPRIYDKTDNDTLRRGVLLNPNYACDAFRYASPNEGVNVTNLTGGLPTPVSTPRVTATGMTPYAGETDLDDLRDAAGLLPRYMNFRLIMTNAVDITPALSPSVRSMAVVYRMGSR
ncbi:MAG: hypothetical protein AAF628_00980 [Planctomycetota bacterium]